MLHKPVSGEKGQKTYNAPWAGANHYPNKAPGHGIRKQKDQRTWEKGGPAQGFESQELGESAVSARPQLRARNFEKVRVDGVRKEVYERPKQRSVLS